jgi:tetrahydromethanopterin S-methyltransferase subunit G
MEKPKKKRVTTLQLFEAITEVKDRLGGVEARLGSVEGHLGSVEGRLGSVELTNAAIYDELMSVKKTVEGHSEQFVQVAKRFDRVDERIGALDRMVWRRFDTLEKRFDAMDKRVVVLETPSAP